MHPTIPVAAQGLLKFIGNIEAPKGYDTIYGNNQKHLPKKLTSMTLDEVIAAQPTWTRLYGSSAAGYWQFMRNTLIDLKARIGLKGTELFNSDLQELLAYYLLRRRGYLQFIQGKITLIRFALELAKEWASFPVLTACQGAHRALKRGQSYYAGDGVNKALVAPATVERQLNAMQGKGPVESTISSTKTAAGELSTVTKVTAGAGCVAGTGAAVVAGTQDAQTTLSQIEPVTTTVSMLGMYGMYVAGAVVGIVVLAAVGVALYKWAKAD